MKYVADTMSELLTPKQHRRIHLLSIRLGYDGENRPLTLYGVRSASMTKECADVYIRMLETELREKKNVTSE